MRAGRFVSPLSGWFARQPRKGRGFPESSPRSSSASINHWPGPDSYWPCQT